MPRTTAATETAVRQVGIRQLKTHLSGCLKQVQAGRTVVVTHRGQPVGRIIPIAATLPQRLASLRDAGHLAWSGRRLRRCRPIARLRGRRTVATLLLEDRE